MRTVVIADYRWKGHRLELILATAAALVGRCHRVYLHLPRRAFNSEEWSVHSVVHRARVDVLFGDSDVPTDIGYWLGNVVRKCLGVGAEHLLLPWADACLQYLHVYRGVVSMPHIHLLLGRRPPGWREHGGAEQSRVHQMDRQIEYLTNDGFACVGSLCAAFDERAGETERCAEGGRIRWVVDPVALGGALEGTRSDARERVCLKTDHRYALVIGDLSARKRVDETVQAWREIYRQTGITLVLAGSVDSSVKDLVNLTKKIQQYAPDSLETNYAYLPKDVFVDYIKAVDVLVCVSRPDTYMSSGTAGIAAVVGTPIFVGGNRYLEYTVSKRNLGLVGDIEAPSASLAMARACELRVSGIAPDAVNYNKFISQWLGTCLSISKDQFSNII